MDVRTLRPEVEILIPYYFEKGRRVSPEYDTPAFHEELNHWFGPLGLKHVWCAVDRTNIGDVVERLTRRRAETPIVVLNLCDGIDQVGTPGVSVVNALAASHLPYSGADADFYETSTSKLATKERLRAGGVDVGPSTSIEDPARDAQRAIEAIGVPVFVKPDISSGSFGVGVDSVCHDAAAVRQKYEHLRQETYFDGNAILAEPFIMGREFTALVIEKAGEPSGLYVLPPGERVFDPRVPAEERYLVYERYWELPEEHRLIPEGEPYYWYASPPMDLAEEIAGFARKVFRAVGGNAYARIDFRRADKTGRLHVIDVNAQCGLSQDNSSTCGSLLRIAGRTMAEMIEPILNHALGRG